MAIPRRLLRPAQAFARVLVQPSFQPVPFTITAKLQTPIGLPITQTRTAVRTSLTKGGDPNAPNFVIDEKIGSIYINLVQEDGTFVPEQPIREVLRDMDRISNFLLQVSAPQQDSEYPYPICRIIPKDELRDMEKEKIKKKKTWDDFTKMVEINWSIAKNDLGHQMKRMAQFLEQGLRVEVVLGPKKGGRKAMPEEIESLLDTVKKTAASVPTVKEYAKSEGEVGRILTMYFSKPKKSAKQLARELGNAQASEQEAEPKEQADEAVVPEKKAEAENESKGRKKASRYAIKMEQKRQEMAGKAEAAKYTDIQEPPEPQHTRDNNPRQESAYEREQRLMREERQRQADSSGSRWNSPSTQPSATPARRPLRTAQENPGEIFGGRTGSFLSGLPNYGSSR